MIEDSINYIVNFTVDTYAELLYQLPDKQKQVLIAINREGQARNLVSGAFSKRHGLVAQVSCCSCHRTGKPLPSRWQGLANTVATVCQQLGKN